MEKRGRSFSIDPIRRAARRMRGLVVDNPERILRFAGGMPHGAGSDYVVGVLHNVEHLGASHYRAVGQDPQLSLTPAAGKLPDGWICLAMQVSTPPAYPYAPQIFFDTGQGGWSEAHSIHLPTPVNGQIVAFFQLPPQVVALRLDVGDEAGDFCLHSVRLAALHGWEAWWGHLARRHLGLTSWYPDHTIENLQMRLPQILGNTPFLRRPIARSVPALPTPGYVQGRQTRLALYDHTANVPRAHEVQATRHAAMSPGPGARGVSVIILSLDKPELIIPLVENLWQQAALMAEHGLDLQILIGDTGTTHEKVLKFYRDNASRLQVIGGLTYQFSRCNNAVAAHARCDDLLLLNNDIIFPAHSDAILRMHRALHVNPTHGIVGCGLYFPDRTVQHLGVDFLREPSVRGLCFHPRTRTLVPPETLSDHWQAPAVTGACLLIARTLYARLGGLDENYQRECQDVALCLAADRLGYAVCAVNAGDVIHIENATRPKGEEDWPDRQRFLRRWGAYIEARYL